ncbi:ROK family transcriptional regulator [Streptomyces actinomycinicus]|uniref:ROK family transcriptional regulator n=1 Tax=Streptomyces actinomycinicus TaxID=1695166 RepID=A0A937EE10_9ACTN|nr:ROK family transcriptional regulator [Streptomyces actinomycinicus]MBL1080449.1 ROK family transcriptional regulator [Streptomyces actinomycinicus]
MNRTRTARSGGPAGANLGVLRSHNTALVLGLLRDAGTEGISRLELAERTGLTPQAVSKITARLREEGFAAEAGRRASTGGKPRTVLRLVPEAGHAVGVHLDRDELRVVLVDLDGTMVGERHGELHLGAGAEAVLGAVCEAVEGLVRESLGETTGGGAGAGGAVAEGGDGGVSGVRDGGLAAGAGLGGVRSLLGVGVALPGPLDHAQGVLHRVTGFPEWDGFPLRDALAERLGVPVVVDKDTNAAALGLAVGGEEGAAGRSFAYLHLGTGLGAGLVFGGSVHRGARTGAGEFGHQVIQLDGPRCECGNRGCVEVLCLGAAARGEAAEAARVLGVAAGNLVGLLDIDVVLLGGRTVAAAPEAYVQGVGEVLDAQALREGASGGPVPVRIAPRGERVVAEGAAQLLLAPLFGRGDV